MLVPLCAYLQSCLGPCSGISFIDSTALAVCRNRRLHAHRTFRDLATRGKTSVGWFDGFKLHLAINERGEVLAWRLTAGHVDDRAPVPALVRTLFGSHFGDKGYLSQPLTARLHACGIRLITTLRRRMTPRLLPLDDAPLLRKRGLIDSVIDLLKNQASSRRFSWAIIRSRRCCAQLKPAAAPATASGTMSSCSQSHSLLLG